MDLLEPCIHCGKLMELPGFCSDDCYDKFLQ